MHLGFKLEEINDFSFTITCGPFSVSNSKRAQKAFALLQLETANHFTIHVRSVSLSMRSLLGTSLMALSPLLVIVDSSSTCCDRALEL